MLAITMIYTGHGPFSHLFEHYVMTLKVLWHHMIAKLL